MAPPGVEEWVGGKAGAGGGRNPSGFSPKELTEVMRFNPVLEKHIKSFCYDFGGFAGLKGRCQGLGSSKGETPTFIWAPKGYPLRVRVNQNKQNLAQTCKPVCRYPGGLGIKGSC